MTQEEFDKHFTEILNAMDKHMDKYMNQILEKINLLLEDMEQRKKEREKYGPLLGY
jgi:hypothetical protein